MKRLALLLIILAFACAGPAVHRVHAANVVVTDFQANSRCGGVNGCTTPGVDSTGATHAAAVVVFNNGASVTLTDNATGSSYSCSADKVGTTATVRICGSKGLTGRTGHTWTLSGSSIFAQVVALTWSGGDSTLLFDQHSSATDPNNNAINTGSVTPTTTGQILIGGWVGEASASAMTCNNGFSTAFFQNFSGGAFYGISACYKIQTSIVSEGTIFDWTSDIGSSAVLDSFYPLQAAATTKHSLSMMGVGK